MKLRNTFLNPREFKVCSRPPLTWVKHPFVRASAGACCTHDNISQRTLSGLPSHTGYPSEEQKHVLTVPKPGARQPNQMRGRPLSVLAGGQEVSTTNTETSMSI